MCYLLKIELLATLICFTPNLQLSVEEAGLQWQLPKTQEHYNAITISTPQKDRHLILFRYNVGVGVIAHEAHHVVSYYPDLPKEEQAELAELIVNFTISAISENEELSLYWYDVESKKRKALHHD